MKWLVALVLSLVMCGGWCAEVEKFPYSEDDSQRVLQLLPESLFVQSLPGDKKGYVAQAAAVDATGAPLIAGWLGVPESACAENKGAMVWFADREQRTLMAAGVWGNDPNSGATKIARRICELGRAKAGI